MSINNLNTYLNVRDAHLRVVSGNVYAQAMNIGGINVETAHGLQSVSNTGNATSLTLEFANVTTGFVTTANAQIGRDLVVTGNATVSTDLTVSANATVTDTLTISEHLIASKEATVTGNLHVTTIRSDSNVVAEYTGPHDRPLRKYPEVALTQNDESATSGYVASGSSIYSASFEYYEAFDLKTNLVDVSPDQGSHGAWISSSSRFDSNGDANLTTSNIFPGTSYRGEYCALKLPKAIKLDNFHIFPRGDATTYVSSQAPKDLRIFGSNDGTTWTHIKQFQNLGFTGRSGLRLHVNDSNTYNEYAFFVEKITILGTATYCAIGGIELYGHEEGSSSLDTTLKSVYNVPVTTGTQLEVYYDAKDLTTMPSTVTDLVGGDQNGAVSGHSPTLDSTDGIKSFKFDGTDDYIESTLTNDSGAWIFSKSLWFKQTTGVPGASLSCMSSIGDYSASDATFFYLNDTYILVSIYSSGAYFPAEWVVNEWTHAVVVMKGTTSSINDIELYINGKKVEATSQFGTATTRTLPANAQLRVGREIGVGTSYFTGSIANFRLYSKALNAEQIQELYDYQKDYFLGSKSQVTLYKGHLGVGVTEPSGQLELAGDERIQEYPPRDLYQYDTNIEGHGVFCVSASIEFNNGDHPAWEAFSDSATTEGTGPHDESVWTTDGSVYHLSSGLYTGSTTTAGIKGEWIQLKTPYKIKISSFNLNSYADANSDRQPRDFILLGSNDGNVWEQMKSVAGQTSGYTMPSPYNTSPTGPHHTVNSTKYYNYFRIVVTANQGGDALVGISRIRFYGTPGPTTLDKGSLTLGRSLDVPRVSRYDVDTETPRPEKIVLDYDTTVNSSPTDISGKGNHAVFKGLAEYSAPDKAFKFDGQGASYIYGSNLSGLPTGNAIYSLVGWINVKPSLSVTSTLIVYGSGWGVQTIANLSVNTSYQVMAGIGGDHIKSINAVITPNTWHHIAAVKSQSTGVCTVDTIDLYVDGVLITDKTYVGSSRTQNIGSTTYVGVGGGFTGAASDACNGLVSNPKIYNVALEPSEVRKLYNLGRTGRSMVISDTAVGIGKAPEAQLDVRGDIKTSGMVNNTGVGWFITGNGGNAVYTGSENWFSSNGDSSVYGTVKKTRNGADPTAWNATTGFFTAPEDGMYSIDMVMFINGFDGGRWGSFELQDSNSNQIEFTYTFYTANITTDDTRSYSKTVYMKKNWKFRFYSSAGTVTLYLAAAHSTLNINKIS